MLVIVARSAIKSTSSVTAGPIGVAGDDAGLVKVALGSNRSEPRVIDFYTIVVALRHLQREVLISTLIHNAGDRYGLIPGRGDSFEYVRALVVPIRHAPKPTTAVILAVNSQLVNFDFGLVTPQPHERGQFPAT
jgi:hypothetical protein